MRAGDFAVVHAKTGQVVRVTVAEVALPQDADEGVVAYESRLPGGARIEFDYLPEVGTVSVQGLLTPPDQRRQGEMLTLVRWLVAQPEVKTVVRGVRSELGAAFSSRFTREILAAGKRNLDEFDPEDFPWADEDTAVVAVCAAEDLPVEFAVHRRGMAV